MFENGKYLNFDIVIEREKKSKEQLNSLDALMKKAEPEGEDGQELPF